MKKLIILSLSLLLVNNIKGQDLLARQAPSDKPLAVLDTIPLPKMEYKEIEDTDISNTTYLEEEKDFVYDKSSLFRKNKNKGKFKINKRQINNFFEIYFNYIDWVLSASSYEEMIKRVNTLNQIYCKYYVKK